MNKLFTVTTIYNVDVRGYWPLLVSNGTATELTGAPRGITVAEALLWKREKVVDA